MKWLKVPTKTQNIVIWLFLALIGILTVFGIFIELTLPLGLF